MTEINRLASEKFLPTTLSSPAKLNVENRAGKAAETFSKPIQTSLPQKKLSGGQQVSQQTSWINIGKVVGLSMLVLGLGLGMRSLFKDPSVNVDFSTENNNSFNSTKNCCYKNESLLVKADLFPSKSHFISLEKEGVQEIIPNVSTNAPLLVKEVVVPDTFEMETTLIANVTTNEPRLVKEDVAPPQTNLSSLEAARIQAIAKNICGISLVDPNQCITDKNSFSCPKEMDLYSVSRSSINQDIVNAQVICHNGVSYEGGLTMGKPQGKGLLEKPDGSKFDGIFEDGQKRKGTFTRPITSNLKK